MHQYYPHLSIRQAELAAMYGIVADEGGQYAITDEVIQVFVDDLERAIRSRLTKEATEEIGAAEDEDDHCIYQVESFSSRFVNAIVVKSTHSIINFCRFIYGYHPDEEVFYRVSFYTTWALDMYGNIFL